MEPQIEKILLDYEKRSDAEHAEIDALSREEVGKRRDRMLLAVGRATGTLLNLLVKGSRARSILELGTSFGYSTIWLAEAARQTGGKVTTTELRPEKSAHAKNTLASVGLASYVDFRIGDALEILPQSAGPFDFVLLDLWKDLYLDCFELFTPKLSAGAIVVADNMLFPEATRKEAEMYRRRVRESALYDSVLLPIGSGLEVSRFRGS
jgi:predicted O-methyltransferase YrrM